MADPATEIPRAFVQKCLASNEMGDATLYIAKNAGKRLLNQTSGEWMKWVGHHWEIDKNSSEALAAMELVVSEYRQEAKRLVDEISDAKDTTVKNGLMAKQKELYRRIDRLRSVRGTNNALTYTARCEDRLIVNQDDFDKDPWALPCKNGVIDLKTGQLWPGDPKDLLMKYCPHEWQGLDAPAPMWEKAILDMMNGNQEMADFINRLFGYSITGLTTEHVLPVFWGKGRNGKSLLVETLRFVLGEMAAPIRSEMLLDQAFMKSSSGPNPDIMGLKGLRIAFANETDSGRHLSTSQVKQLTGADSLVARNPHDKYETRFYPTHTLYLLTNNKPHVPSWDFAIWKRLILIPFGISFVDEPRHPDERLIDKELGEKLKQEAAGILAWLVRGCLVWQFQGLNYPQLVMESTGEYRNEEDFTADFVDECCIIGKEYKCRASDLYDSFTRWWEDNQGKKVPSQKVFGKVMAQKFDRKKNMVFYYHGLGLLETPLDA